MKRWQRLVLWIVGGVALVAALVALLAPGIIRQQAIRKIEATTGRKLTIGRVFVNPLTLSAGAEGVTLTEKGSSAPFVSFSSARISLSPRSIYRGVPIVSSVQVVSPSVNIVRSAPNVYNFSDLLQKEPQAPAKKEEPAEFCINNIAISRGTVVFRDQALPAEKVHTVGNLSLGIPFISSIAHLEDRYISPRLDAVVNGAPLHLDGKLKKGTASAEVLLSLNLKELSLPWYMPYLPGNLGFTIPSGAVSTAAGITYRVSASKAPQLLVTGTVSVRDVAVKEKGGAELLRLSSATMAIREADPLAARYDLDSLALDEVEMRLERNRQGAWNVSRLVGPSAAKPKQAPDKKKAPVLHVGSAVVRHGRLHFTDNLPAGPFAADLRDIAIDVNKYASDGKNPAQFALSLSTERGEKLTLKGEQTSVPLSVKSSLTIDDIALSAYYPYLSPWLTSPLTGRAGIGGELLFDREAGFRVKDAKITGQSIAAIFAPGEALKIKRLALDGGTLDLKARRLAVERVAIEGSDLRFSRDARGVLSPLKLLREQSAAPAAPAAPPQKKEPFAWSIGSIAGNNMAFAFVDGTIADEPPEFTLRKTSLSLKNLASAGNTPVPFKLAAVYGDGGAVSASGDLALRPVAVRGTFGLKGIPVTDFAGYLPGNLNISLADGSIDARGRMNVARKGTAWTGSFGGDLGVRSFYCLDAADDDLLKWESLQLEGVSGTVAPFALSVNDVVVNHYFAKVIVERDGTLNLQHLAEKEEQQGAAAGQESTASAPRLAEAPASPPASRRNIRIGAVVLQDGLLNFTDNHLNPSYSTTFYNLGGRVSGLSSESSRFADVDLRGNLENQSPLLITGQINPLRDDLFVNLTMRFTDIELSPLSPYSSTYLGYLIDKGKLFLDLKYHIEQKKLESQNTVFLDQLTLGSKVDSPRATSLPVRLAIALLKDRKGEIHLDLPVSGRTDDPKFSVWGVVLEMLKNLAVKAATAPFTLLSSLFGGSEDFGDVRFAPGVSTIAPGEGEKLLKLANALKDRPALKIEMSGFIDSDTDPEGLRRALLDKKIRTEKFLDLVKEKKNRPGESPDTMQVTADEYPKYLKMVYRKEKFPKPRTMLGLVKDLPEEEMKKLILTNTVIGPRDLQELATDRAMAVRDFLIQRGGLDAGRIFQKSGDVQKKPGKQGETGSRVEFGMVAE